MEQNSNGFDRAQMREPQSWRRSRSDRMVAGVCGGIGRALNIDPVLVRVVMAVLIISGPGVLFYAAAWVLMPDEGSDRSAAQGLLGDRVRPDHPWLWPIVIGVCVFAAIALMSSFNFGKMVPGPLIVLGLLWLFVFRRKGGRSHWSHGGLHWTGDNQSQTRPQDVPGQTGTQVPGAPYHGARYPGQPATPQYEGTQQYAASQSGGVSSPTGPSAPPAGPSSSATQAPQDRTVEPVRPVWTEDDPLGLYADEPPAPPVRSTKAEPPAKGLRGVKPAIVALTGLALAIAWLAGASTPLMLAIGLATLGGGMLIGGFLGRTLALLPLGILLALGVAFTSVFNGVPRNFVDANYTATPDKPITATNQTYTFDAGAVKLDLTKAKFAPGAKIVVDGGLGEVLIKVPANVDVTGTLTAKAGELAVFGEHRGGHKLTMTANDLGADEKAGPESVALDLKMDLGSIKVERG
jgi:phage shock protein PspC (stress-responsive transcriptional regulator)